MDVSIVILNYRSAGLIKEQLRHYFKESPRVTTECIVVDNNSRDNIARVLASHFPQVRLIQSDVNRGYGSGNNLGIAAARGSYVLIANPDIVLTAELVDTLYAYMETHSNVGIAGPKIINADGTLQFSCVRFPDLWLPIFRRTMFSKTKAGVRWLDHYFMKDWDHHEPRAVDWLFGSCLFVRKTALEQVGVFDERFFLYLEDTDWCRRFWMQGYEVHYVPTVSAVHLLSRSSEVSLRSALFNRHARSHMMSFIRYFLKYFRQPTPRADS